MAELDVLTVRLEADIARFQQQLDRAKAQLSGFAAVSTTAEKGAAGVGAASLRSSAGVSQFADDLARMAARASGASPVLGRVAGSLASFASGPMMPVLIGLGLVAAGFAKIRNDARDARAEVDKTLKSITDMWLAKQTQGDIDLINLQGEAGSLLDAQARKVQRAREASENKEYLAKLLADLAELQTAYDRVTTMLADRRSERQREAAERAARAEGKAANDAATAWKRAYQDIESSVRLHHSTLIDTPSAAPGGFDLSAIFVAPKQPAEELARTFETVSRQVSAFGKVMIGPDGKTLYNPGKAPGLKDTIRGMLDPTMIASGVASGFISTGINFAIGGLTKLAGGLLGFGDSAERAAAQMRHAMMNFRDAITYVSGTDAEKAFASARSQITQQLAAVGMPVDLSGTRNFAEMIAFLEKQRDIWGALVPGALEAFNLAIELAQGHFKNLNNEVDRLTSGLRNMPSGFKVNLAEYNATRPTAAVAGAGGASMTIRIVAEPEGIFRVVETQAVRKIRSGGVPQWEIA